MASGARRVFFSISKAMRSMKRLRSHSCAVLALARIQDMDALGGPEHGEKVKGIDFFPIAVIADSEDGADIVGQDGIVFCRTRQYPFHGVEDDDLVEGQAAELERAHHLYSLQRRALEADGAAAEMGTHQGGHAGRVSGMENLSVAGSEILQFLHDLQRGSGIFVEEQMGLAVGLAAHALQGPAQKGKERRHVLDRLRDETAVQAARPAR